MTILFLQKKEGNKILIMLVHVDDIMIARNDSSIIDDIMEVLVKNFKIKGLGELKIFLGMEIARTKEGITSNQRKYILELISDFGMAQTKPIHTPFKQNIKLTTKEYDDKFISEIKDETLKEAQKNRKIIGRLLYLTSCLLSNTSANSCMNLEHLIFL